MEEGEVGDDYPGEEEEPEGDRPVDDEVLQPEEEVFEDEED